VIKINFKHDKEHWQFTKFIADKKLLMRIFRYICELINNNINMNLKFNRIRQILVILVLIAAVEGFSSCEKYSYTERPVDPNATWHFQTDIQPVFNSICITCHGGVQSPDLRTGKSYQALTKGGFVKSPGESSILYIQITTQSDHIPRTTAAEKLKILYWINQGAQNN
jgi:hypothetical protein